MIKTVAGQQTTDKKKTIWKSISPSEIRIHADSVTIENHIFLYDKCLGSHTGTFDDYVISQKTIWQVGWWEGNRPTLSATAIIVKPDGKQKRLWSLTEEADEGELTSTYHHTYYLVSTEFSCSR
jgi:hypothetical protein